MACACVYHQPGCEAVVRPGTDSPRCRFVPSVDKKNQGARKENLVVVKRKKGKDDSTVVPYHVIDNPSKFGATEWYPSSSSALCWRAFLGTD